MCIQFSQRQLSLYISITEYPPSILTTQDSGILTKEVAAKLKLNTWKWMWKSVVLS